MCAMRSWTLTDVEGRTWVEDFELKPSDVATASTFDWRIRKSVLHGGVSDGVDLIEIDNGNLAFTVVPTRGMGLWRGTFDGNDIGWDSPVRGPVHPFFVNPLERGGLGWLRGFDECIVRCGLSSNGPPVKDVVKDNNGNPMEVDLTLHGHIANIPANRVEIQIKPGPPTELIVVGVVDETMLFGPRLRLVTRMSTLEGSNTVTISDRIVNMGDSPTELSLLYHCNYGPPFLDEGATLVSPSLEVAPRDARAQEDVRTYAEYRQPTPGYVEQVYWHDLAADADGATTVMLRSSQGDCGVVVRYDRGKLPAFTQWKNTAGEKEGYVTGLEPGINFPNPRPFEREQGRIKTLAAGESFAVGLSMQICNSAEEVGVVEKEIAGLAAGRTPSVHPAPIAKWTPQA